MGLLRDACLRNLSHCHLSVSLLLPRLKITWNFARNPFTDLSCLKVNRGLSFWNLNRVFNVCCRKRGLRCTLFTFTQEFWGFLDVLFRLDWLVKEVHRLFICWTLVFIFNRLPINLNLAHTWVIISFLTEAFRHLWKDLIFTTFFLLSSHGLKFLSFFFSKSSLMGNANLVHVSVSFLLL